MRKFVWPSIVLIIMMSFHACFVVENPYTGVAPGPWRAILKLEYVPITPNPKGEPLPEKVNLQFDEVTAGELPFTFEVVYDNETDFHIEIINDEERLVVNDIVFGRDRKTGKDTIMIDFPVYDSYIKAIVEESVMEGEWVVKNRGVYSIPFVARQGMSHRFTTLKKPPTMDISGKWEAHFADPDGEFDAIGEFVQDGNHLSGTFLTETGDYRYLEGSVQANKVYLSTFDGAHAFLFEAKILEDSTMIGSFRSGKHYQVTWSAKRNENFELIDPLELTYLNEGYDKVDFSFKNAEGQIVSLSDEQYQDKIKIVQILGTWCPNCRDETQYLTNYLKENPNKNLEVIALAFEKYRAEDKALNAIKKYKDRLGFDYEILLAGYYNKKEAAEALPMLNHILSYPTMIFIDRNDQVRRIHTGFSGPATSEYTDFKEDFENFVSQLLQEPNQ